MIAGKQAPSRRFAVAAVLTAASTLLQCGCVAGPSYRRPEAPANAGYSPGSPPEANAAADTPGGEAQLLVAGRDIPFEWWELFQSPALNALINKAFNVNPNITAARAALAQAQELASAQRGYYSPAVAGGFQAERHKIAGNVNSSETPGVQANGDNYLPRLEDPNHFPHNTALDYTFHTAAVTVGFVPDVFGSNRRQVESLDAQADRQRFALEAAYVTVASNVVASAIQEATLQAQIGATQRIIDADTKSLRILQDQLRLGFATRLDVAAQEAALAQVAITLPELRNRWEQTRDLLRALVGSLPTDADGTFELDALRLPRELPLSLPAKLVEQRPDVRAAEAQLRAANAQVGVAVAAMLPQFSIAGSAGGNATQIPWMFRSGGPFWNIVGDVRQPIFAGGTLLHNKRAASAALAQAAAQYQSTVIAAYQNVADTLHASLSDAEALAADVAAEKAAKVTYELTRWQMDAGYVSYLTLLSAEAVYNQALLTRVQALAAHYGDTVALFQALGGGWWHREEIASR